MGMKKRKPLSPPAFEPWAAQPLASHYINSRFLQSTKVLLASIGIMMMETTSLTKIHQEAHNLLWASDTLAVG